MNQRDTIHKRKGMKTSPDHSRSDLQHAATNSKPGNAVFPVVDSSTHALTDTHFSHDFSQVAVDTRNQSAELSQVRTELITPIQAKAEVGLEGGPLSSELAGRINASRANGTSLDENTLTKMEDAFGSSFGDVRLHNDKESNDLNRNIHSAAFTTGKDIYFREGAYQAGSIEGHQILAHELTHVLQQRSMSDSGQMEVGPADDQYEQEAEAMSSAIVTGIEHAAHVSSGEPKSETVQRYVSESLVQRGLPVAVEALEVALTATIVLQEQHAISHGGLQVISQTASRRGTPPQPADNDYNAEIFTASQDPILYPGVNATLRVHWQGNKYGEMGAAYCDVDSDVSEFTYSALNVKFTPLDNLPKRGEDMRLWPMQWIYDGTFDPAGPGKYDFSGKFEIDAFGGFRIVEHVVIERSIFGYSPYPKELYVRRGPNKEGASLPPPAGGGTPSTPTSGSTQPTP